MTEYEYGVLCYLSEISESLKKISKRKTGIDRKTKFRVSQIMKEYEEKQSKAL